MESATRPGPGAIDYEGSLQRLYLTALDHPVAATFLIALLVRVSIALFLTRYFSGTLILDDTTYHGMISAMASGETGHWDQFTRTLFWSTATLCAPVTLLYKLFGSEMVVGQLFVGVTGSVAVAAGTRLALELMRPRWAIAVGLILALLPSQAFWSSMLMKDAPVWMTLISLALVVAVAGRTTGRRLLLLGGAAAALLAMLTYLRLHTLVIACAALVLASFFGNREQRVARVAGAVVLALTVPWVLGGIGPGGIDLVTNAGSLQDRRFLNAQGANTAIVDVEPPEAAVVEALPRQQVEEITEKKEHLEDDLVALRERVESTDAAGSGSQPAVRREQKRRITRLEHRIDQLEQRAAEAAAAAEESGPVATPPRVVDEAPVDPDLAHLPRGISVMLLEPFPVPFTGTLSLRLARLETLIWYPLLILAAIGLLRTWRRLRVLAFPLIAGAAIVIMYALTEGNVGTAHRHRGEFVWVVVLLAGAGMARVFGSERDTVRP